MALLPLRSNRSQTLSECSRQRQCAGMSISGVVACQMSSTCGSGTPQGSVTDPNLCNESPEPGPSRACY